MALATIADVEARLGRVLTNDEEAKATAWLNDASALFVNKSQQKFEPGETTFQAYAKDGVVRLLQRPVTAIVSVEDVHGSPVAYEWDGFQALFNVYSASPLKVVYEHGSTTIPEPVVAVVAGMVARTLSIAPDAASGITKQTTGPFTQEYASWAVGSQVMLSPAELSVANSYRQKQIGTASILGNKRYSRMLGDATHFGN